jgi:hypothetical protein
MKKYIMSVHGYEEDNIQVLLDDGNHTEPTYENIVNAYKTVVAQSRDGDSIFLHYSGEFLFFLSITCLKFRIFTILNIFTSSMFYAHTTGHGTKIRDDDANGEESDGYDEALCPRDFQSAGMIRDDDLYDLIVKPLADGVHLVSLMDCCHSGSILDLPYTFAADGQQTQMDLNPHIDIESFIQQHSGQVLEFLQKILQDKMKN